MCGRVESPSPSPSPACMRRRRRARSRPGRWYVLLPCRRGWPWFGRARVPLPLPGASHTAMPY